MHYFTKFLSQMRGGLRVLSLCHFSRRSGCSCGFEMRYCSHELRENFWRWILDSMPLDFCGYISQLDDIIIMIVFI